MVVLGEEDLRGEATFGGEKSLGKAIQGGGGTALGLAAFGGEYVRGDPIVSDDRSSVGDILVGKGKADACGGWVMGDPTVIWSESALNVTTGSRNAPTCPCLAPKAGPRPGLGCLPLRAASTSSVDVLTCTPMLRDSIGIVCTPRPRYFLFLLDVRDTLLPARERRGRGRSRPLSLS